LIIIFCTLMSAVWIATFCLYAAANLFHIAVCTVGVVILSSPVVDSRLLRSERLKPTVFPQELHFG
jgi:hypothetical protein